jgi:hypothetical protein
MLTKLHFSESDSITVAEDFPTVLAYLKTAERGWIDLHEDRGEAEDTPVAVNVAAVRCVTPYEPPESLVA